MKKRKQAPKGPPSLNSVDFTLKLSKILSENEPIQKFHVWSVVTLVGQPRALEMLDCAMLHYQDDSSRSLGAWWFRQLLPGQNEMTRRIRKNMRQVFGLETHSVPDIFYA